MARPTKQGLDYFPVDVQFDEKVELFVAEAGADGLGILLTIWQLIYQNEGYYIKNNDDLLLLIRRRVMAETRRIKEVIDIALRRRVFDPEKNQQFSIITSKALQKRFFTASRRKREIIVCKNYLCDGVSAPENSTCNEVNVAKNATKEKEKEKEDIYALKDAQGEGQQFSTFWERYPKKRAKKDALKAWKKIKFENGLFKEILASLDKAKETAEWQKDNGQFIPYPASWLNGRRWEDDHGPVKKKTVGGYEFD